MHNSPMLPLLASLCLVACACVAPVGEDDIYLSSQLALGGGGPNVKIKNPWSEMGVVRTGSQVSIDSNVAEDGPLIDAEGEAAEAAGQPNCVFGAHGLVCEDQAEIQSFPDDPIHVCACAGILVLSVCYGGADPDGEGPNGSIAELFSQECGVAPEDVRACTGTVSPGNPMVCNGQWVDGNGDPTSGGGSGVGIRPVGGGGGGGGGGSERVGDLELKEVGDGAVMGPTRCGMECNGSVSPQLL